jgi:hypothetical protein
MVASRLAEVVERINPLLRPDVTLNPSLSPSMIGPKNVKSGTVFNYEGRPTG